MTFEGGIFGVGSIARTWVAGVNAGRAVQARAARAQAIRAAGGRGVADRVVDGAAVTLIGHALTLLRRSAGHRDTAPTGSGYDVAARGTG